MTQKETDSGAKKKTLPGVTVMPEFGGLRVVMAVRVKGVEIGDLIPWQRIEFHRHQGGTSLFLTLESGKRVAVSVKGGFRGSRVAVRLKARWSERIDDDPVVCYEPTRQSVRAFMGLFVPFGGLMLAGGIYLGVQQAIKLGPMPWSLLRWIGFAFVNLPLVGAAFVVWLMWRSRPRQPQYERVAVSEAGLLMEGGGPTVDILWSDVRSSERISGDPLRFRLTLASGERAWLVVPRRVRTDVLRRMPTEIGGVRPDDVAARRAARGFALRLLIIGATLSASLVTCVLWLFSRGLLSAADARRIAIFGSLLVFMHTWMLAGTMFWGLWRSTPRGRRAVRRWSRRARSSRRPRTA